jgi:hypothetical protein
LSTLLATQSGDRRVAALLLGSLSLLVVLATLAWRAGTLRRLRRLLGGGNAAELSPVAVETSSDAEVRRMGW